MKHLFALTIPVAFAAGIDTTVPGKIFEVGEYADKKFTLSEEEADAAIAAFTPVGMCYGHNDEGPLPKGAFGNVQRIWREGKDLMADFAVPNLLLAMAKRHGVELKLSAIWDRDTKRVIGCDWARFPRIKDAAVKAAFSEVWFKAEDLDEEERNDIPLEDFALPDERKFPIRDQHEADSAAHLIGLEPEAEQPEIKKRAEAICKRKGLKWPADPADDKTAENKKRFSQGVVPWKGKSMKPSQRRALELARLAVEAGKATQAELDEQIAAFSRENEVEFRSQSVAFADSLVQGQRILPAHRKVVTALFAQALRDDAASDGKITFTIGETEQEGLRVDLLKALFNLVTPHNLTDEQMSARTGKEGPADFALAQNNGGGAEKPKLVSYKDVYKKMNTA